MKILVDVQALQTRQSKNRGIGRLSSDFLQLLLESPRAHQVFLLINGSMIESVHDIKTKFSQYLSEERFVIWHPLPFESQTVSEKLRETVIQGVGPDVVLTLSLFEGFGENAITAVKVNKNSTYLQASILYDLIPFMMPETYLKNEQYKKWYYHKLSDVNASDVLFCISKYTAQSAEQLLDIPVDKTVVFYSDIPEKFQEKEYAEDFIRSIKQKFSIKKDFIFYTAGMDPRKNIHGLIEAFARMDAKLRASYQLVITCHTDTAQEKALYAYAQAQGLKEGDFVVTGFVNDEELVALYSLCYLFVFPSFMEGFGLPLLEAMRCGAVVIGANSSSVPEVIGLDEALFDPFSIDAIQAKMTALLEDKALYERIRLHVKMQAKKFYAPENADFVWNVLEKKMAERREPKKTLAYLSPLLPDQSGIADYSGELIPALSQEYQITLITDHLQLADTYLEMNYRKITYAQFEKEYASFDRVLYHFGNSVFHRDMLSVFDQCPGVVVLHDFYLSGLISSYYFPRRIKYDYDEFIYKFHGYKGLIEAKNKTAEEKIWDFPVNLKILSNANGLIVHSKHSEQLLRQYYPQHNIPVSIVKHLRKFPFSDNRSANKKALCEKYGISEGTYLICVFGHISANKMGMDLLRAFKESVLSKNKAVQLLFVGALDTGSYGLQFEEYMKKHCKSRVSITGYADAVMYKNYLSIADLAIQLRTRSRGETSGAITDCLAYGVPTIINRHASLDEFPDDCVYKISDPVIDSELRDALELLYNDTELRAQLRLNGPQYVMDKLNPKKIAGQFYDILEHYYMKEPMIPAEIIQKTLCSDDVQQFSDVQSLQLLESIQGHFSKTIMPTMYVDISTLIQKDYHSGIQRVVKIILKFMLEKNSDYRIEPIYFDENGACRLARNFCFSAYFPDSELSLEDARIFAFKKGDLFFGLDLHLKIGNDPALSAWLLRQKAYGVQLFFVMFDMLPVTHKECFSVGSHDVFKNWLDFVEDHADRVITISETVAAQFSHSIKNKKRCDELSVHHIHLGSDIREFKTHYAFLKENTLLKEIENSPYFLMVSTLEPRKSYDEILSVFEVLWQQGFEYSLIIVGKKGWMVDKLIEKIYKHPMKNKKLFWFNAISDSELMALYQNAFAYLMYSKGEGFGLGIVEAAQYGIPLLLREIPVFREIAGEHAFYLPAQYDQKLCADKIKEWLLLREKNEHPLSTAMPILTWEQSYHQLLACLKGEREYQGSVTTTEEKIVELLEKIS